MRDEEEYTRWMKSAQATLASARSDAREGFHNWACFKAQQAAELALKALSWGLGVPVRGHSVSRMLRELAEATGSPIEELGDCARFLDSLYIPTRYADAWSEGSPQDYYGEQESRRAIQCAEKLLEWVKGIWRSLQ